MTLRPLATVSLSVVSLIETIITEHVIFVFVFIHIHCFLAEI